MQIFMSSPLLNHSARHRSRSTGSSSTQSTIDQPFTLSPTHLKHFTGHGHSRSLATITPKEDCKKERMQDKEKHQAAKECWQMKRKDSLRQTRSSKMQNQNHCFLHIFGLANLPPLTARIQLRVQSKSLW